MSYNILTEKLPTFLEGVQFIQAEYPYYDKDKLIDKYSSSKYSVQMIEKSVKNIENKNSIFKFIIFDILIGNSDRHHSNWAIAVRLDEDEWIPHYEGVAPLYDNGSSLCAYVNEKDINSFLEDSMRYESLIDTKSKSIIGWKDKAPIRHFELLEHIKTDYYNETIEIINKLKEKITEDSVNVLLNAFNNDIISKDMKILLKKYILDRKNRMIHIYGIEGE